MLIDREDMKRLVANVQHNLDEADVLREMLTSAKKSGTLLSDTDVQDLKALNHLWRGCARFMAQYYSNQLRQEQAQSESEEAEAVNVELLPSAKEYRKNLIKEAAQKP